MRLDNYINEETVKDWQKYVTSNKMLSGAISILKRIKNEKYRAYIVGGAVRDIIMGNEPKDIDIATNCPIDVLEDIWYTHNIGKSKDFGIVAVFENGYTYEIAQFRSDGKYLDGRRPEEVKIELTFKKDAARRDFTINAMAIDIDGNIIDYFDGTKDVKDKVIKTVGDPRERFGEDYVRMLRAARFSSKLGFEIDSETKNAAKDMADNVNKITKERITMELIKAASQSGYKFAKYLMILDELGILKIILPEITKLKELYHQEKHHPEAPDVFGHIIAALKVNKIEDPLVNLAILLHDVGKGVTLTWKNNRPIYMRHAEEGIELINNIADRLKLSNIDRDKLIYVVGNHMKFFDILKMKPSKVANLVNDENFDVLVAVAKADEMCRGSLSMSEKDFNDIVEKAIEIKNKWGMNGVNKTIKLVDGNHVMELTGLKPGKKVGEIIKKTTEWIIDQGIKNQDEIDKYILRLMEGDI